MSKKMGSLEFTKFILLFSVIHQISCDNPEFASTLEDESYVPKEYRLKRSHAYAFGQNSEKTDEATRANTQGVAKNQIPRTRLMNLCIGEPKRRRAVVPLAQPKATATVIHPKDVATIIQTKDGVTGTVVHPKVSNTPTISPQKPIATTTVTQPRIVPAIQPQIIPEVSAVQPKCVSISSVIQPNVSSGYASVIKPKVTATATTVIETNTKPLAATELADCTIHHANSTSETHHDIHEKCNDSFENEHHYVVDLPADQNLNNTNTIHHVIDNHTHSVSVKNLKGHEHGAFYEENSNGAKILHTNLEDTSHNSVKATNTECSTSNNSVVAVIQNKTDHQKICSSNDKPVILEMATPKPNVKQQSVQTISDILKQVNVQLLSTPKPLTSGNIGGINMEENDLDKIKLEPDDDIVIDKFDVEEVKESFKNPSDYTNDVLTSSSSSCIYPAIENQGMQGTNGQIISYDEYVNYFNNGDYNGNSKGAFSYNSGSYKDNSKVAYPYPYNNHCGVTPAPKPMKFNKTERSVLKDRIWRKWINTQIYIRRPAHENFDKAKVDEHVQSKSWSQEQKIPVIGFNGYYTNQNSSNCS